MAGESADDISTYLILNWQTGPHRCLCLQKAISAGAMIRRILWDIVMRQNTTIGDAAPITMGDSLDGVERESRALSAAIFTVPPKRTVIRSRFWVGKGVHAA